MKLYIALALFCLSTGVIAGEVGMPSADGGPSTQSYNVDKDSPKDTASAADGQVNLPSSMISPSVDVSAAHHTTVDSTSVASDTSYTASDGVTYGLEKGSVGDTGVNLTPKQPNMYDDRAHVQLHKSPSFNTPFKRPEFEFGILVGGSGSYIPVNEHLRETSGFNPPEHYKFHLSGEGLSTGMNVYAGYRRGNNTFGASMAGYVDTHTLKNYDHKREVNSGEMFPSMTFLARSYTLEFAARAGHYFDDIHLYGKLGVICSAFQYKFRHAAADARKNLTAWGGSLGTGVQKPFSLPAIGDTKIGLEYNYQIYESLKPVITYTGTKDTSKFRPRYHTGFLTIAKTF